jgi:3'-phosphoadenosine 5'-phosphosulfate (PAPS) 3'-phosphatase
MSWSESRVLVSLTRQQVKDAPAYESAEALDRRQEEDIYKHYGKDSYWDAAARHKVMAPGRENHF